MILERASKVTGLTVEEITGRSRERCASVTRIAIMDVLRKRGDKLDYIATLLNRDRSTVILCLRRAEEMRGLPGFEIIRSAIA